MQSVVISPLRHVNMSYDAALFCILILPSMASRRLICGSVCLLLNGNVCRSTAVIGSAVLSLPDGIPGCYEIMFKHLYYAKNLSVEPVAVLKFKYRSGLSTRTVSLLA